MASTASVKRALDDAIELLEEMKDMLETEEPLAFLEAAVDVRHNLDRALVEALGSVLRGAPGAEEEDEDEDDD